MIEVAGGELADLEERRAGIEQPLDAVAGQQLAARRRGARGASRCRPSPPWRRPRATSRPARGCARRGRGTRRRPGRSSCRCRGALMPYVRPLVENACRPPSGCGSACKARPSKPPLQEMTCVRSCLALSRPRSLSHRCLPASRRRAPSKAPPPGTELGIDLACDGQARQAGRRLLHLRQRQLGQEHADPGRPVARSAASTSPTRSASSKPRELLDAHPEVEPGGRQRRGQIANYYNAYLNTDAIDRAGMAPGQGRPRRHRRDRRQARSCSAAIGSTLRADTDPLNATNFQTENLFGIFVTQGLEHAGRDRCPI